MSMSMPALTAQRRFVFGTNEHTHTYTGNQNTISDNVVLLTYKKGQTCRPEDHNCMVFARYGAVRYRCRCLKLASREKYSPKGKATILLRSLYR